MSFGTFIRRLVRGRIAPTIFRLEDMEKAHQQGRKQGLLDAERIAWQFGRGIRPRVKGHIMPYPYEIAEAIRQKAEELK